MHSDADRICYPTTDLDTKPGEESFVLGKTLNTYMRVRWIKLGAEVKPFLDGGGEFFFFCILRPGIYINVLAHGIYSSGAKLLVGAYGNYVSVTPRPASEYTNTCNSTELRLHTGKHLGLPQRNTVM